MSVLGSIAQGAIIALVPSLRREQKFRSLLTEPDAEEFYNSFKRFSVRRSYAKDEADPENIELMWQWAKWNFGDQLLSSLDHFHEMVRRGGVMMAVNDHAAVYPALFDGIARVARGLPRKDMNGAIQPDGEFATSAWHKSSEPDLLPNDQESGFAQAPLEEDDEINRKTQEALNFLNMLQQINDLEQKIENQEAKIDRLRRAGKTIIEQRERWKARALAAEAASPSAGQPREARDDRFDSLRRLIAQEFHPDRPGLTGLEKAVRAELFKVIWPKVEELSR